MWKLLHRGIIVLVRKRHHSVGLRVEAMDMSYIKFMYLYELLFGLRCDTVVAFFIVWHFYMGKLQSAKQGNLLLNFCFSGADEFYSSLPYRMCNLKEM